MADGDDIEQKIKLTYETNAEKTAKKVDKLDESIQDTTDSQKENEKQTKKQKKGLDDLGGGIGGAIKGFKGLIVQAWKLVTNPVGLVIAAIALALTGLFKAFTSTKGGAEKFDQVMDGISATIDVVRDRVLKIAGAIAKFFSGDFAGAIQDGRDAVSGFGDEVAREFQIAADARKSLQQVADTMRELSVSRARLNRDLVKAKEIIESETASYDDKKRAIKEVTEAEEIQTALELENAQKKLDAIRAQNAQSDSSSEALQAEAEAEIALFNIQEKSASNKTKNILLLKKAENEEIARKKAVVAAEKEVEKGKEDAFKAYLEREKVRATERENEEKRKQQEKDDAAAELQFLEDTLAEEERIEMEAEDKRLANAQKADEKQAALDKTALEQKKTIEAAKFSLLSKGVALFNTIFGKSKKGQKAALLASNAVGLAEVGINTAKAVSNDLAVPLGAGIPKIPIDIAAGALGAANIIASTAKGLKELGGGSAGSATGGASPNVGASATPQVNFQASSENQIATTIAENTNSQPVVEAFVVESSVTTAQALARNKIEANTFGS